MKKANRILLVILAVFMFSACDSSDSYPVSKAKVTEDITNYMVHQRDFMDVVSIEITSHVKKGELFTVTAQIEYKDTAAVIKGTIVMEYYKGEVAWVKKAPIFTFISAVTYAQPELETIFSSLETLDRTYIERGYKLESALEGYQITSAVTSFPTNTIIYDLTKTASILFTKASFTIMVEVRYIYPTGWQATKIIHETFEQTTQWDGAYKAEFGTWTNGELTVNKTLMIDLSGSVSINKNELFEEKLTTNTAQASFVLDGVQYKVDGEPGLLDAYLMDTKAILFKFGNNSQKNLEISIGPKWNDSTLNYDLNVVLDGQIGKLTLIE